jgi:hypothetical protein
MHGFKAVRSLLNSKRQEDIHKKLGIDHLTSPQKGDSPFLVGVIIAFHYDEFRKIVMGIFFSSEFNILS